MRALYYPRMCLVAAFSPGMFGINDSLRFNGPEPRDAVWYEQRQLTRAAGPQRHGYAPLCFDSLINLALSL